MARRDENDREAPVVDQFRRPIRSSHWRWTMPPPRMAGFPVAAWSPLLLLLTPLPNITGFEPVFVASGLSLAGFWLLERSRMTPRMGRRKLMGMIRGLVTLPMATRAIPAWERGLMQPLQFRRARRAGKRPRRATSRNFEQGRAIR